MVQHLLETRIERVPLAEGLTQKTEHVDPMLGQC